MADSIYAPHNQHKLEEAQAAESNSNSHPTNDANGTAHESSPRPPHPHITQPLLYISGVDPKVTDKELASSVFDKVLPVRLKINRNIEAGQTASGTVEFQTLEKGKSLLFHSACPLWLSLTMPLSTTVPTAAAEKAYAIVRSPIVLRLSPEQDAADPKPDAKPRLVKQLPPHTDDAMVYDMFRQFGALAKAQCILTSPSGVHTGFRGMASLEFYSEQEAQLAQDEMHCVEVGGKTISVAIDTVQRRPSAPFAGEFSATAAPFVPGRGMNAAAPSFSPTNRNVSGGSSASIYASQSAGAGGAEGTGPNFAVPGSNLQYSTTAATYIDPCNLFCKNLDPAIDSNELFSAFKKFGRIVSARVMRDNEGKSREFGFVSFTSADDAGRALRAMNNTLLGNKQVTVRLHEPKKMRQEKLAARFAGSSSTSENGTPRSPGSDRDASPTPADKMDRRQSNSYFKAAMANSDGSAVDEDQLRALTPVVRNEVLAGEFNRRVKELPTIKSEQVDGIVSELVKLKLAEAVEALNNPVSLFQHVSDAKDKLPQSPVASHVPASATLGVPAQRTVSGSSADNLSIMSSAPASSKERERILKAVIGVLPQGSPVEDITDMLASLPKKERALCMFNPEFLKSKVDEAREILDMEDEEDGAEPVSKGKPSPEVEAPKTYTLASLSKLPAAEIVSLANSSHAAGLPLPKPDPAVVKATDEFIDSLDGKPPHDQKQKLGDQLFKKIRTFGIKGAPKITIALLDSEELRPLAHLMNSYEAVLKEKVLALAAAK